MRTERLLLTRPAGRNEALLQALGAAGVEVSAIPLQQLQALAAEQVLPDNIDILIVVSPAAVEFGAHTMPAHWRASVPVCAVGQATAAALRQDGWQQIAVPAEENSEGVLALPALQPCAGKRCLLLRGDGGRELIASTLRERGAQLTERIVYRRLPASTADQQAIAQWVQRPGAVLCASGEALQMLCAIISPPQRQQLRLLCLGARVSALARAHFPRVTELPQLNSACVLQALNSASGTDHDR